MIALLRQPCRRMIAASKGRLFELGYSSLSNRLRSTKRCQCCVSIQFWLCLSAIFLVIGYVIFSEAMSANKMAFVLVLPTQTIIQQPVDGRFLQHYLNNPDAERIFVRREERRRLMQRYFKKSEQKSNSNNFQLPSSHRPSTHISSKWPWPPTAAAPTTRAANPESLDYVHSIYVLKNTTLRATVIRKCKHPARFRFRINGTLHEPISKLIGYPCPTLFGPKCDYVGYFADLQLKQSLCE